MKKEKKRKPRRYVGMTYGYVFRKADLWWLVSLSSETDGQAYAW